jgi:hypothetical protein
MKASGDFTERRLHERASLQNIVLGVLNSDEPVTIGIINDISLGGVKYTHELNIAPNDNPIHSIDLIAGNDFLMIDIPCEFAWNVDLEQESSRKLSELRQCGIQFGKLTLNQIFLLRSLMNRCTSPGTTDITPDAV